MKKIFILLMTSLFLLSGIGVFAQNDRPAVRNRALGSVREVLTARELDGSSEVIERRLERETMIAPSPICSTICK